MIILDDVDKDGTHIASLLQQLLFTCYKVNKECELDQMRMYASMRKDNDHPSIKKEHEKMKPIDITATEIIEDQSKLIGGIENG